LWFHECFQTEGRGVPLRGDIIEVFPRFLEPFDIEREHALAAAAGIAHQARAVEGQILN